MAPQHAATRRNKSQQIATKRNKRNKAQQNATCRNAATNRNKPQQAATSRNKPQQAGRLLRWEPRRGAPATCRWFAGHVASPPPGFICTFLSLLGEGGGGRERLYLFSFCLLFPGLPLRGWRGRRRVCGPPGSEGAGRGGSARGEGGQCVALPWGCSCPSNRGLTAATVGQSVHSQLRPCPGAARVRVAYLSSRARGVGRGLGVKAAKGLRGR